MKTYDEDILMMFDEEAKIFVEYERKATPGH
jgi:hypothetical protein